MIHHIFTQNYLLLNSMTFDKFHNGRLHLILKTALILFINNYPTLEANVIRFLKFMTLNLILCVLNLTKLTSIFHIYSSYDTNISAHIRDVCMFSRADACKGYGLRILSSIFVSSCSYK